MNACIMLAMALLQENVDISRSRTLLANLYIRVYFLYISKVF